ncbi:repair protein rad1/Rec1/Rad17 domain-containing protein [Ditylenchus destructor]|nr:repair protein rad1/Rec1/Rad17 domain-containing protein [Ditylenchus destructor]
MSSPDVLMETDEPLNDQNADGGSKNSTRRKGHILEMHKVNARELYSVLKAIAFMEYCTMVATTDGLKIVVDDHHHQQASVYLDFDKFADFMCNAQSLNIRFPINPLIELLNVFTSNMASLRMYYDGEGEPLVASVDDEGAVFHCAIATHFPVTLMEIDFAAKPAIVKVIMQPHVIREIVREIDISSATVKIIVTKSIIAFYTDGDLGMIKTEIPSHSDLIESFEAPDKRMVFCYKLTLIRRMLGFFVACNKVSMQINEDSVLNCQFLIPHSEKHTMYADSTCFAIQDDVFS